MTALPGDGLAAVGLAGIGEPPAGVFDKEQWLGRGLCAAVGFRSEALKRDEQVLVCRAVPWGMSA